jgi:hypothetical protein
MYCTVGILQEYGYLEQQYCCLEYGIDRVLAASGEIVSVYLFQNPKQLCCVTIVDEPWHQMIIMSLEL